MTLTRSPLEIAVEKLFAKPHPYLNDPVGYVRDVLRGEPFSAQTEMMGSVRHHRNVAVKAAHSVGKTRALAWLTVWWVDAHPIGQARVVITSDNDDNIKGGVWQEIIALHEEAKLAERPLPGTVTLDSKWHAGPNNQTLVAQGRKPGDRNPTGLQGFHRKYLLVLVDECAGVPAELWEAAESLASNAAGVVPAGNPTDPSSHFAEVCKPGSGWEVQRSAHSTPLSTPERRFRTTCSRTWSRRSGWRIGRRDGGRRTRGTSPAGPVALIRCALGPADVVFARAGVRG
jgi:hypothetical protein